MLVKGNHPLAEIILCKLFSIDTCPPEEQRRMVSRATKAALEYHASAITSAVEAERERCAMVAENGMAYSSGIEIATAIRQTPTQGER